MVPERLGCSAVKVFISCDIEGVAGIVDWNQTGGAGPAYTAGCRLMLGEVNAAIAGATEAGAAGFVVNDSHSRMNNLPPEELVGSASYLSGHHKPLYMMQGLDESFDAVFFVGYHGSISGDQATLSHTYSPEAFWDIKLNGISVGESGINALVALAYGVPVALVTGDQHAAGQIEPHCPHAVAVVVKRSITRSAAENLHPEAACRAITAGAKQAIECLGDARAPAVDIPASLDITLINADYAELAAWIDGVTRTGIRSVRLSDSDPLALYRRFVTVDYISRALRDR